MDSVTITIPGAAMGKGRPRIGKTRSGQAIAFTPKPTKTREGVVASLAMDAMGSRDPFSGPVEMVLSAVLPIPKSWPKKRQAAALSGEERPTTKPDLDNIAKLIWDGLNSIVYSDDKQIVRLTADKRYGVNPVTVVTVREIARAP
ncbi:RusA family crossover junction endodeoxyribonuclease [Magnetospirillum fulvum]|uniref:Holliday junction resolvase n=1 Tax=Magnetospirillum fulvum MGU-K5 TaxID=1316936 RepID=S9TYW5_MAGFU|nr:RusA family crossover junction endodeoxyribonuclease [Magnetospirillum fulvum]EPY03510.1 Holliday junction resolvase [Magnetospirillum fulvum MGU-K5]